MLSSFSIQNFRSILSLKLDFSYGEGKAPNGYQSQETIPFIKAGKQRLVPCMAFFGANASGKTNLLKALGALDGLILGAKLADAFEPNLLNPKFADTTFEINFHIGIDSFIYLIAFSATKISKEDLQKNGKPIFEITELQPTFDLQTRSETYSKEKLRDILRVECSDGEGRQIKPFLHCIGRSYPGLDLDLKNTFSFFQSRIRIFDNEEPALLPAAVDLLASAMNGNGKAALGEITDTVRRLDVDISAIEISETKLKANDPHPNGTLLRLDGETDERHLVSISTTHQDIANNPVYFDFFKHESAGTQRLAGLVGLILYVLKIGGVFVVDELECSLHPLLMREIVLLFKKRRHNPKGAQLIFTTHNTDILDDAVLRISEIALVRKTIANGTLVRRLVDAKSEGEDIRNVTNFRKQYLAGFYSGVPHPAL